MEIPPGRSFAARSRCFIVSDLSRYAVSRSEAISRQSSIGTITAVGSPASLETNWMSASATTQFTSVDPLGFIGAIPAATTVPARHSAGTAVGETPSLAEFAGHSKICNPRRLAGSLFYS